MNQLVQNIIKPFLPEEQKPGETIAVYGGSYKPPTLGHFEVVNKALKEYPEITRFIVYVGAGVRDGITQEESVKIWEIYKRYLPLEIKAVPNPITAIYDFAKTHPNDSILWVLGSRPDNEADFDDFKKKTKAAETRPNLVPVNIVTDLDISGTKVRQNLKDKEYVFKSLPPISQPEKQEVYNILMKENVTPDEAPSSKTSYQTLGLKTVRVVVEGEGLEKDKEKVLALIKKQSPNSKVDFYPATGKIVGVIEANKLDSIKRDLRLINKDYKISEKKQQLKEEEKIPGGLAKDKSTKLNKIENNEGYKLLGKIVDECCESLKIKKPKIKLVNSKQFSTENKSFGCYMPSENKIYLEIKGRNLADSTRTLIHELYHSYQNHQGLLEAGSGDDGSKIENEANAYAGKTMREIGRKYPEIYNLKFE